MSEAEIHNFLGSQSKAIIIAGRKGGAPWGAVGRLHYDGDRVAFSLRDNDPLVAQLAQDGRACCVVEQFPSYYEIMSVMLHGHATRRAHGEDGAATFDLAVDKIVSFNFGKLASNPART